MRDESKNIGEGTPYFIKLFLFSTTKLYICKKFFHCCPLQYGSGAAEFFEIEIIKPGIGSHYTGQYKSDSDMIKIKTG
jgi:hypothetical protein